MEITKNELSKILYLNPVTMMVYLDRPEFNHIKRIYINGKRTFLDVTDEDIQHLKQLSNRTRNKERGIKL